MNRRNFLKKTEKGLAGIVLASAPAVFSQTTDGIHVFRIEYWNFPGSEYKFRNVPDDMPYIPAFPREALLEDPYVKTIEPAETIHERYFLIYVNTQEGKTEVMELKYFVFTSISDAELSLVRRLYSSVDVMYNAIDFEWNENIGDNCWYDPIHYTRISFIRNNVWVDIRGSGEAVKLAKKIDTLLCSSEKVKDIKLIKAPVINSVEILQQFESGDIIDFKIDAYDPQGQNLTYRWLWGGPNTTSYDGVVRFYKKYIPLDLNQQIARILVWNEDRIVTGYDYFLIPTAVEDEYITSKTPQVLELFYNQPNPFNEATTIKYNLPENTKVSLDIYNISGQKIKTLVDKIQEPGSHQVIFNANNVTSGIYFYQLRTQDGVKTQKMMLVK